MFKRKYLSIVMCFIMIYAISCIGDEVHAKETMNTAVLTVLNTTTRVPITLGGQTGYGYSIVVSDCSQVYISVSEAGAGEFLLPEDFCGIDSTDYAKSGSTVMWVKSLSGTPSIILIPWKKKTY